MERDYSALKEKMGPYRSSQARVSRRTEDVRKDKSVDIEDVEKELKSATVREQGKQYFADLYLLKKGR